MRKLSRVRHTATSNRAVAPSVATTPPRDSATTHAPATAGAGAISGQRTRRHDACRTRRALPGKARRRTDRSVRRCTPESGSPDGSPSAAHK
ncbi:hypothetical protein ACFOPN_13430 [Xanthomonas hyacinthi]|uniref:hypothetical protein n=1 Tax=Xanthomonas hyacinthi TaxID=56455 RepID=UPI00361CA5B5